MMAPLNVESALIFSVLNYNYLKKIKKPVQKGWTALQHDQYKAGS
jgi:hypothetical protein